MKLPFLTKKAEGNAECYFGLFFQQTKVTGYVYELLPTRINILAQHTSPFTNGMDNVVEDIDDILFRLETDSNKKLKNTIFFVTSHYIDPDTKQIKKDYKVAIKKITQELELKPLGFIECYEAVADLIAKKEGVHLNLILVELDETTGHIFIYKSDKLIFDTPFERTEKLANDLTHIFTEIKGEFMLPTRMVVYPYNQSHKELVHLVNHNWSEDLFMQMPKVESVSEDDLYQGLSEIFFVQLKEQVPENTVETVPSPNEEIEEPEVPPQKSHHEHSQELPEDEEEFTEENHTEEPAAKTEPPHEVMGFAIGKDMTDEIPMHAVPERTVAAAAIEHDEPMPKAKKSFSLLPIIGMIKAKVTNIRLPLKSPLGLPIIGGVVVILLLLLGSEFFLHKEVVTVTFPNKVIEKTNTFTGDDLKISEGDVTTDETASTATTGKRDIGDKAKGDVTIRSFDSKDKTIAQGTALTVDNKKFILDQDVKVASASMSSDNTTKVAGQAKGSVTADTIGPDYNVDKNTKFHVDDLDFATYFAINDAAFTGGTKKQAQTVARKDIDSLKAKVLDAGKKQGLDKMRAEVSKDQQIIDKLTAQNLTNADFSKDIGDESNTVSVKAKVTTTYYTYAESELQRLLQKTLLPEVPSGYTLPTENIKTELTDSKKTKDTINLTVKTTAKSVKKVSKDDIVAAIKGKGKSNVEETLKSQFDAQGVNIEDKGLSIFPWMPFFKKNITVEINST